MRHIGCHFARDGVNYVRVWGKKRDSKLTACSLRHMQKLANRIQNTVKKQVDHIHRFISHNSWTHWFSQVEWTEVIYISLDFPGGSESDFHM